MSRDPRRDRARKLQRSPYARIRAAALAGRGVRLTADEVADLYDLDQSIQTRADADAAGLADPDCCDARQDPEIMFVEPMSVAGLERDLNEAMRDCDGPPGDDGDDVPF